MKKYQVILESAPSKSFRCTKAANSLDIDVEKKLRHTLTVEADIETPYNIGLIVGASGSGKTTLAKSIFGEDSVKQLLNEDMPIIDQFPEHMNYKQCAETLSGVGLTSVPCWIRPAITLSTGQRARAEAALQIANQKANEVSVIDEWTSVVDRTVAKVMSHCISKAARKANRQIVLLSCHYDIFEWLNPDWVIDCNTHEYIDRRRLCRSYKRQERLDFTIREADKRSWPYFSKYHYLNSNLPGGRIRIFGLYKGDTQIGFQCYANYVPHRKSGIKRMQMHSNRTVIHPDYAGLGLGIKLINATSMIMAKQGYDVRAKTSSVPIVQSRKKQPAWSLQQIKRDIKITATGSITRKDGYREKVKAYAYKFHPEKYDSCKDGVTIHNADEAAT